MVTSISARGRSEGVRGTFKVVSMRVSACRFLSLGSARGVPELPAVKERGQGEALAVLYQLDGDFHAHAWGC